MRKIPLLFFVLSSIYGQSLKGFNSFELKLSSSDGWESSKRIQIQQNSFLFNETKKSTITDRALKFLGSQFVFGFFGMIDYSIKEAPMYPSHRSDDLFWQGAWPVLVYGSSFSINLLVFKQPKYLLGCLTEDLVYYLCRSSTEKKWPERFELPFQIGGIDNIPFKTFLLVWGAATIVLVADAIFDFL